MLGKQTSGSKPLNVFLWAYPYRLIMGIVFAVLVYWTPYFREANGEYPYLYYIIWIAAYYLHQVFIIIKILIFFIKGILGFILLHFLINDGI